MFCIFAKRSRSVIWNGSKFGHKQKWPRTVNSFSTSPRRPKSSYFHCPGEKPLSPVIVGQLVDISAEKWPDKTALVSFHQNTRLSFRQVRDKANQLAAAFVRLGLESGDRLGIWAPNCEEWYLTQMAAAKAGLILVTINPLYEANELRACLRKVQAKGLVYGDQVRNRNMHNILMQAAPDLETKGDGAVRSWHVESLQNIIAIGSSPPKISLRFEDLLSENLEAATETVLRIAENIQPDDPCNVQFTSGTTGLPKAAVLSHHNIVNNSYLIGDRYKLNENDENSICMPNPLFHAFGCVIGTLVALSHGIKLVMPSPLPSGKDSLRALQAEKCTIVYGTPTMHIDLLNAISAESVKKSDLCVKIAVTAGAFCPAEIQRKIKTSLADFVSTCYGMTECSPVNFQSSSTDPQDTFDVSVGKLCDHWEAKVVDLNGKMVPFGSPGELWVRGYGTMLGYWQDERATNEALRPDGWLRTGDQFVIDERGFGKVVGRIKDLIIRGGENIYPGEVEDVLQTHPDIVEAQVVGIPNARLGEVVCAAVRVAENKTLDLNEVKEFCKGKMAQYKIPLHIIIVQDYPKTATGKIQKFQLKEVLAKLIQDSK
ncbi:medium-chain acyl-CoA ligase ACSF2, mitochondrial isoform X2 [Neocloeon triangulifer]|uniref:medium-chain acyl-CoA ligase ACSF2, mitochondrial isoform X2 n=1 Tax=Neocloeon triangulifer TaxID=2078957 RepID=UPI00286F6876|nr:medium-chain acyl-CoA ligase ACSF2, mitochondrial isoform X2 [Neocloeon triangulifer]